MSGFVCSGYLYVWYRSFFSKYNQDKGCKQTFNNNLPFWSYKDLMLGMGKSYPFYNEWNKGPNSLKIWI